MKIIFMGTPEFAVPILERISQEYEVVCVVSQPDKAKGRGKKIQPTPIKELALKIGINNILQPDKINSPEIIEKLKSFNADLFVVVAYGQILTKEILQIPKYCCINVHASLLPKYRGAAPIQWSIINGDLTTGVTIMNMDEGMDTGDILLTKEVSIDNQETYGTLYEKLSYLGANTLIQTIPLIKQNKIVPKKQEDSIATYAPRIFKDMGKINWNNSSKQIINLIRGLNPTPSAFSSYNNEIIKIHSAEEINGYSGENGQIVDIIKNKGIVIKTSDSAILITHLQAKGGKKMSASDYLRGHTLNKGEFFI